jgi:ketosteroid isomerase-like protein
MKNKIITIKSLVVLIVFILFGIPCRAQIGAEIESAISAFQEAYNIGDNVALNNMFTTNAEKINTDGTTINGAEKIAASYKSSFTAANIQISNTVTSIVFENENKAVSKGSFTINGTLKSNGDPIFSDGTFENTYIKENGVWKISRMKLTDNH